MKDKPRQIDWKNADISNYVSPKAPKIPEGIKVTVRQVSGDRPESPRVRKALGGYSETRVIKPKGRR